MLAEQRLKPPYIASAKRALGEVREASFLLDADSGSRALEHRVADAAEVEGVEMIVVDAAGGWATPPEAAQNTARELRSLGRDRSVAIVLGLVLPYDPPPAPPRPPAPADLLALPGLVERDDTVLNFSREELYDPYTERQGIAQIDVFGRRRHQARLDLCFLDRYPRVIDLARPAGDAAPE